MLAAQAAGAQQAAPAVSTTLREVTVSTDRNDRTEGKPSYTTGSMGTATRLGLSMRETPQSTSVVTRQRMDDFALTTVADVLAQSTGITVNELDSERTSFYARGFAISNFQIDGMSRGTNSPLTDTLLYDRIEIVRGATGLMGGTGDPSATVNFIRKRPSRTWTGSATLQLGRWDLRRAEVDLSGPLTADGRIRGRIVAADSDRKSFMDYYHEKKRLGMAVIEADLTPSTLLSAGIDAQDNQPRGATWGAVPYWNSAGQPAKLPRSFSITTPWSGWDLQQQTAFASLDHRFDGGWKVRLGVARTESEVHRKVAYAGSGYPNQVTGAGMSLWTGVGEARETRDNLDLYASGPFQLLGRRHELIVGWNGSWSEQVTPTLNVTQGYSATIPNYLAWTGDIPEPTFTYTGASTRARTRLGGGYAAVRLSVTDPLSVIAGARVSNYAARTDAYGTDGGYTRSSGIASHRREVTPYLGAVYDINDSYSAYASYTDVFAPQAYKDRNGNFIDPATGSNVEAGIKGEYLGGRVNAYAAVFRTVKKNLAQLDAGVPAGFTLPDGSSAYVNSGSGTTARGFEAEVTGQITPSWNAAAGYTYVSMRRPEGSTYSFPVAPRHLVRLSSAYRPGGALQGLTAGAALSLQTQTTNGSWYNRPTTSSKATIVQPGYGLVDLFARYQVNRNLSVALNVGNLLDKHYYRNIGFYDGVYWGEPRNVRLTMRASF